MRLVLPVRNVFHMATLAAIQGDPMLSASEHRLNAGDGRPGDRVMRIQGEAVLDPQSWD